MRGQCESTDISTTTQNVLDSGVGCPRLSYDLCIVLDSA